MEIGNSASFQKKHFSAKICCVAVKQNSGGCGNSRPYSAGGFYYNRIKIETYSHTVVQVKKSLWLDVLRITTRITEPKTKAQNTWVSILIKVNFKLKQ